MQEILAHPEIVNPYGSANGGFKDQAFVTDLNLENLLQGVPFHPPLIKESRAFAKKILVDTGADRRTAEYRQAVFDDLVPKAGLRESVRRYVRSLNDLAYKLDRFQKKQDLPNGLAMARLYQEILDNPLAIGEAKSEALKSVSLYLGKIRTSDSFSQMKSLLKIIGESAEIEFRVSLDRNGSPLKMYALEMARKDLVEKNGILSLLERLLGKKRYEHNLRTTGGLNELGKIIRDFMERQFIPLISAYKPQIQEMIRLLEPLDFYAGFAEYFAALKERNVEVCKATL